MSFSSPTTYAEPVKKGRPFPVLRHGGEFFSSIRCADPLTGKVPPEHLVAISRARQWIAISRETGRPDDEVECRRIARAILANVGLGLADLSQEGGAQ